MLPRKNSALIHRWAQSLPRLFCPRVSDQGWQESPGHSQTYCSASKSLWLLQLSTTTPSCLHHQLKHLPCRSSLACRELCPLPVLELARLQGLPPAQSWASSHHPTAAEPTRGHSATGKDRDGSWVGTDWAAGWEHCWAEEHQPAHAPAPHQQLPLPSADWHISACKGMFWAVGTGRKKAISVGWLLAKPSGQRSKVTGCQGNACVGEGLGQQSPETVANC